VRQDLSALASLKRTWTEYSPLKGGNVPAAALAVLLGIIPMAVLIILFLYSNLLSFQTGGNMILSLSIIFISLSLFFTFILTAFDPVCKNKGYRLSFSDMKSGLRSYGRYLVYSLLSSVYFILIYVICFGFPNFASDPILRLVFIVLVNYWLAVVLPVPVLMERQGIGFWGALRLSYRHFHVLRWNLYLLGVIIFLINLAAFFLVLIPLVITLPLSWYAIRDYTDLLLDFEIIRDQG